MCIKIYLVYLIIIFLIIIINKKEKFYIECSKDSIKLQPHNSYKANLKGWCTTAEFDKIEDEVITDSKRSPYKCANGTYRKNAISSYNSDLKAFC